MGMRFANANETVTGYTAIWRRCRDAIKGQDSIKAGRTLYLPKTSPAQSDLEYQQYIDLAYYPGYIGRVFDGLFGMLMGKDPIVSYPPAMEEFSRDVTLTGKSLVEFIRIVAREVLTVNRYGIMVDYGVIEGPESMDQVNVGVNRPRFEGYVAEEIIDWSESWVNGRYQLDMIELFEGMDENDEEIYRKLYLDADGLYVQQVRIGEYMQEFQPRQGGRRLDYLPFIFIDSEGGSAEPVTPVLLDAINANVKLYQASAELCNARHLLASPTPYFFGFTPDEVSDSIRLGTNSGIVSTNPDAKTGFLTLGAEGIAELRQAVEDYKEEIAVLGGRILAGEKKAVESAEAAEIHRQGENSVLSGIAMAISEGMEMALLIASGWTGGNPEEISVKVNQDYYPRQLNPQLITALGMEVDKRHLTLENFFQYMKKSQVIDREKTFDEWMQEIERMPGGFDFTGGI